MDEFCSSVRERKRTENGRRVLRRQHLSEGPFLDHLLVAVLRVQPRQRARSPEEEDVAEGDARVRHRGTWKSMALSKRTVTLHHADRLELLVETS